MDSVRFKDGAIQASAFLSQCGRCQEHSLYVCTEGTFGLRCSNQYCMNFTAKAKPLCSLQHMRFDQAGMKFTVEGELPLIQRGKEVSPDFDQIKYDVNNLGVWTNCMGLLEWADKTVSNERYQWLKCPECAAKYRFVMLITKPTILLPGDGYPLQAHHEEYRLVPHKNKPFEILLKSERPENQTKPMPWNWVGAIDRVIYNDQDLFVYKPEVRF